MLAILLAFLQFYSLALGQTTPSPALTSAAEKIKQRVAEISIGGKHNVRKLDGTEYHGSLQNVSADSFSIDDVDLNRVVIIHFNDVDCLQKNYGGKGINGKRVDHKRSLIVADVVLAVLVTVVLVAVAKDKS